jgi:hypothetical protein
MTEGVTVYSVTITVGILAVTGRTTKNTARVKRRKQEGDKRICCSFVVFLMKVSSLPSFPTPGVYSPGRAPVAPLFYDCHLQGAAGIGEWSSGFTGCLPEKLSRSTNSHLHQPAKSPFLPETRKGPEEKP